MSFVLYCLMLVTIVTGLASPPYYWREYLGEIPEDAISSEGVYVAQVSYFGTIPVSFYPQTKTAVTVRLGVKWERTTSIKLLCSQDKDDLYWEYTTSQKVIGDYLNGSVIGGEVLGFTMYIGKVYHEGEWKIGKVFSADTIWKGLRIWNRSGFLYVAHDFQILRYRQPLPIDVRNS